MTEDKSLEEQLKELEAATASPISGRVRVSVKNPYQKKEVSSKKLKKEPESDTPEERKKWLIAELKKEIACHLEELSRHPLPNHHPASIGNIQGELKRQYKALGIGQDDAKTHYHIGFLLEKLNEADKAKSHYQKAIEIKPCYKDVYANLGALLISQGDNKGAIALLEEAKAMSPGDAEIRNNLGVVLQRMGREKEAAEEYTIAVSLDEEQFNPSHNLGLLYEQKASTENGSLADLSMAMTYLDKAVKILLEQYKDETR